MDFFFFFFERRSGAWIGDWSSIWAGPYPKNVQIRVQPTYRINRDLIFSQYSIDTYPCPMRIGPAICDLPAVGEKKIIFWVEIFFFY